MKNSNRIFHKWPGRRGWLMLGIFVIVLLFWLEWLGSEQPVKKIEIPVKEISVKPVSR